MSKTSQTNRRQILKGLGAGAVASSAATQLVRGADTDDQIELGWSEANDRPWIGPEFWANPMEDWCTRDGKVECIAASGGRNVHWITKRIVAPQAGFRTSITVETAEVGSGDSSFGFRLGVRSDIDETRSNCFASGGIPVGVRGGKLILKRKTVEVDIPQEETLRLEVTCKEAPGGKVRLQVSLFAQSGQLLATIGAVVAAPDLIGNVCFVNGLDSKQKKCTRYRFSDWILDGDAVETNPDARFGAILWTMYTLTDSRSDDGFVLRLTALLPPLGKDDSTSVHLEFRDGDNWERRETTELDPDSYTATFELRGWDETVPADYRVVYDEARREAPPVQHTFEGTVRSNPKDRPLRMAAMTCQKDYAFPYEPVAENVLALDPDLVYFSGDQLYENHGGFGIIREPADRAILNYLRKYYMFGWAFRECMRSAPTVCIPDDHDVFQGNIWGEGGAPMKDISKGASSKGGYREPARMVNVVHRTNASHHPQPADSTPVRQGISVYYGDLVYGDVSFAILSDRQFKSGPTRVETGSGRADHVLDPSFDTAVLDRDGLVLLGERQESFLQQWASDWRGHSLKVVLSQTVFAGVATHHGKYDGYLKADLDSGGWPQTARDRAIEILKPASALHINGDQHLTSLCQYGVDKQRDAFWSFCTPAIAAGYPRWWRPDEIDMPHEGRPDHDLPNTGEYLDGFGNRVYVYAVGNPEVGTEKNRYDLAHQKGSGFGWVVMDPKKKTYTVNAFRFRCDPKSDDPSEQFPGWPVVIHQSENAGGRNIGKRG